MQQKSELPEGWIITRISEVGKITTGNTPSKKDPNNFGDRYPWVKPGDLDKNNAITETEEYLSEKGALAARLLPVNTVLISCIGNLGKVGIAGTPLATNQQINSISFEEVIVYPKYGYYYCKTLREWLEDNSSATTIPIINKTRFSEAPFSLPPLSEQYRIVSAIEALFAHLDVTNEKLDRVLELLKTFRQAVIKLALQGKLVGQNPIDEPALKLIETIRTDQTKDKIEKKKLISDSEENLFELPYSWKWIRLEELLIFGPKNGYSPKPVNYVTNVRALTLTATTSGKFRDDCFKYIDEEIDPKSHLWLEENDILIQRGNTIEYVGIAAIYTGPCNAFIYPDLMMKIRVHPKINVGFLHMVINSKFSHKYFEKKATGTSGSMPKINQSTVVNLPIPLPPLTEQQEIVRRVDALFTFAASIEAKVKAAREKTEKLRQSILAKAFSGQLVETEAEIAKRGGRDYESAEVLLERIKKEKSKRSII